MPQLQAAKKALRQNLRRREVNDRWRQLVYRSIHAFKASLQNNDSAKSGAALIQAQKNLDRAARRNIINPRTAARKKSRLAKQLHPPNQ